MTKQNYEKINIIKRDGIGDLLIFLLAARSRGVDLNHQNFTFYTKPSTSEFVRLLLPLAGTLKRPYFSLKQRKNCVAILPVYTDILGEKHKRFGIFTSKLTYSLGQFSHKNPVKRFLNKVVRIAVSTHRTTEQLEYDRYISFIDHLINSEVLIRDNYLSKKISNKRARDERIITIFPGASELEKRWSCSNFLSTAQELKKFAKINIVLGPAEKDIKTVVKNWAQVNNLSINFHMCPSPEKLVELVNDSSLVLSNDSMAVHLAAYLGVPGICTAWGVRQNRFLGHLSHFNIKVISEHCDFLPCYKCVLAGEDEFKCIKKIPVAKVVQAAKQLILG